LSDADARELVSTRRGVLRSSALERLVREAGGNPLALLELPADGAVRGGENAGVEATFRARMTCV
jgi:hypothetical protein